MMAKGKDQFWPSNQALDFCAIEKDPLRIRIAYDRGKRFPANIDVQVNRSIAVKKCAARRMLTDFGAEETEKKRSGLRGGDEIRVTNATLPPFWQDATQPGSIGPDQQQVSDW